MPLNSDPDRSPMTAAPVRWSAAPGCRARDRRSCWCARDGVFDISRSAPTVAGLLNEADPVAAWRPQPSTGRSAGWPSSSRIRPRQGRDEARPWLLSSMPWSWRPLAADAVLPAGDLRPAAGDDVLRRALLPGGADDRGTTQLLPGPARAGPDSLRGHPGDPALQRPDRRVRRANARRCCSTGSGRCGRATSCSSAWWAGWRGRSASGWCGDGATST